MGASEISLLSGGIRILFYCLNTAFLLNDEKIAHVKDDQAVLGILDSYLEQHSEDLGTEVNLVGNIEIKDIVRLPGERAKVAVFTNEEDIDPVGACIGVKGNRILAISKELQGEKVDIIEWSDNPLDYAKAALSPAKIQTVFILNKPENRLQAVVSPDQLSLAIGKKGTNVRLASNLVGWKIEIKKV